MMSVSAFALVPNQLTPLINEVKVRYDSNTLNADEYIEIVNPYTEPIDLNQYVLEYFNTTNPTASQLPVQKSIADGLLSPGSHIVVAKQPAQIPYSMSSPFSSLSDTRGRLRLVTAEGGVVDEIAWTNVANLATAVGIAPAIVYQCNVSNALCNTNRTQSISRQLDTEGGYVTNAPTWLLGTTSPLSADLLPVPVEPDDEDPEETPPDDIPEDPEPTTPVVTCEGIVITELLPNPDGSDTGHEFIELYNPTTEVIALDGCVLQISSSTKTYKFSELSMQPNAYLKLPDSQTGLTLPNAAGGTVWLLTPTDELQAITYPSDVDDDVSWSLVTSVWQQSYSPTPGQANIAMPIKPCPTGQQRNPVSNRCESVITTAVATLTSCKTGQERNPDTNRCRTVVTASSLLVACKVGQERNPDTNRCRSITTASTLTPCDEGQERNPDTNRCRKVTSAQGATLAAVKDVKSDTSASSPKWWLAIAAATLAIGYGVFEWRHDIKNAFTAAVTRAKR